MNDDFFDNLGPTYTEVMRFGEKVYEKMTDTRIAQVWLYEGQRYAMVWDKKTGRNLRYTDYEEILKEKEARKRENQYGHCESHHAD